MTKFQEVADELAAAFEQREREDKKRFTCLKDDAPKWIAKGTRDPDGFCLMLRVHRALDDRMPDDWVYEHASRIADSLTEYGDLDEDKAKDMVSEIADGLVDVYNHDRAAWLASNLANASLVDEACEDLGHSEQGIHGDIGYGQYLGLERICNALIEEITTRVEELEEEESK